MNTKYIHNDHYYFARISEKDIDQILNIENHSYSYPWNIENFKQEILTPGNLNTALKLNDDTIVGYCFCYHVVDQLFITNLCIHPDYRNKKFGLHLLQEILSSAKKINVATAFLEVRESNLPGLKLYLSQKFIKDGIRKNFHSNGENAILMHLDLVDI
jgi:[ribosomal protein S18]-alanine N-acetyltransferase